MGAQNPNPGFKPWVNYKKGLRPIPDTPKTILGHNSAYTSTKTMELPKLRTLRVGAPTMMLQKSRHKHLDFSPAKSVNI